MKIIVTVVKNLVIVFFKLRAGYCTKLSICIISFNAHNNPRGKSHCCAKFA